jgi:hypothetical protein
MTTQGISVASPDISADGGLYVALDSRIAAHVASWSADGKDQVLEV